MRRPPSAYSKALAGSLATLLGALVIAFGPDSAAGKWCAVAGTVVGAYLTVSQTRNTAIAESGPGVEPRVTELVTRTGDRVGEQITDTGAATGGIVAGTTGLVGRVVDATVGRLLPSGQRRS